MTKGLYIVQESRSPVRHGFFEWLYFLICYKVRSIEGVNRLEASIERSVGVIIIENEVMGKTSLN